MPPLLSLLGLLLLVPRPSSAQADGQIYLSAPLLLEAGHKLSLSGEWKYHPGDDPVWATPALDDGDWERAHSILHPDQMPESGWDGIGWFRLHVEVDSTLWKRPLAFACKQFGASEIYLDGRLIHRYGRIDSSGLDVATDIDLGPKLLTPNPAAKHLVAVRHTNTSHETLYRAGTKAGFTIWVGELAAATGRRAADVGTVRMLQQFSTGVLIVFSLFHLLMFLFYPALKRNFYVGIFAANITALVFLNFQLQFVADLTEHTYIERMWRICVILAPLTGAGVCYAFLYNRFQKTFWAFLAAGTALGVAACFRLDLLSYVYYFVLLVFLDLLRLIGLAMSQRRRLVSR